MTDKFDTSLPPFDRLTATEQHTLRSALDVVYFRAGETVITAGDDCHQLYIIIKGNIEEYSVTSNPSATIPKTADKQQHKETFAHYANDDLFDVSAQLKGRVAIHLKPAKIPFAMHYRANYLFCAIKTTVSLPRTSIPISPSAKPYSTKRTISRTSRSLSSQKLMMTIFSLV